MKRILLQLKDSEFIKLNSAKVKTFLTWEHFILELLKDAKHENSELLKGDKKDGKSKN